ncbi:hypothetical protein [Ignavibacterium album]|uniref:hypothetical protein n=1 Tax=Ignavibacterium album TaxID=591197 RepID=UPI0026EC3168|nr:hypothetical protein [Ignavibacterium album]
MKKLILILVFLTIGSIYPQLGISGGIDYASFTAGSFKNTKLENNKYWFNGWFINFGLLALDENLDRGDAEMLLHYYNRKAITKFNGKEYHLTNGEVSLSAGQHILLSRGLAFSIVGELGVGWIGSDTPFDHSGVYGNASISIGPFVIISRARIFALAKLNVGFIYFSGSDPDLYSLDPLPSSSGLISGPEFKIGASLSL